MYKRQHERLRDEYGAGVCLAAARHASGLGPVAYDDPVDLSEYDIAYTKEDE